MNLEKQRWRAEQRRVADRMRSAPRDRLQRQRAAYHEAGHAVLAHMLGVAIQCVELTPADPNRTGALWHEHDLDTLPDRHGLIAAVAMIFAAEITERKKFGDAALARLDYEDIERLTASIESYNERQHILRRSLRYAYNLVDIHWASIQRVAAELVSRGRLEAKDFAQLLGPAPRSNSSSLSTRSAAATMPCAQDGTRYPVIADQQAIGEVRVSTSDGVTVFEAWRGAGAGAVLVGRFASLPAASRAL
jgi:hypothetical protein